MPSPHCLRIQRIVIYFGRGCWESLNAAASGWVRVTFNCYPLPLPPRLLMPLFSTAFYGWIFYYLGCFAFLSTPLLYTHQLDPKNTESLYWCTSLCLVWIQSRQFRNVVVPADSYAKAAERLPLAPLGRESEHFIPWTMEWILPTIPWSHRQQSLLLVQGWGSVCCLGYTDIADKLVRAQWKWLFKS